MLNNLQDKARKKRLLPGKLAERIIRTRRIREGVELRETSAAPEQILFSTTTKDQTPLQRAVIKSVEFLSGQSKLRKLYEHHQKGTFSDEDFFDAAIRLLQIDVRYDKTMLAKVPQKGPVLFIANHPYGVLDGLVLIWLGMQARPEVKILANDVLGRAPELKAHLLPIDFGNSKQAIATNVASRQAAEEALLAGQAIGIFPAGGISTTRNPLGGPAFDFDWIPYTARLVHKAQANVVPIYFSGQNSRLFHMASHVSFTLRTSLLFRETIRRIGTPLDVFIGEIIPYEEISHLKDRKQMVEELRRRTFALAPRQDIDWMKSAKIHS